MCVCLCRYVGAVRIFIPYIAGAGATTSGACILCQPGTYQTGSGLETRVRVGLMLW